MSDTERSEITDRILKLEVIFENHERLAVERKGELARTLEAITVKLDSHQCAAHQINMLTLKQQYREIKETEIPELAKRLSFVERCLWMGLGGLAVLEIVLRIFGK